MEASDSDVVMYTAAGTTAGAPLVGDVGAPDSISTGAASAPPVATPQTTAAMRSATSIGAATARVDWVEQPHVMHVGFDDYPAADTVMATVLTATEPVMAPGPTELTAASNGLTTPTLKQSIPTSAAGTGAPDPGAAAGCQGVGAASADAYAAAAAAFVSTGATAGTNLAVVPPPESVAPGTSEGGAHGFASRRTRRPQHVIIDDDDPRGDDDDPRVQVVARRAGPGEAAVLPTRCGRHAEAAASSIGRPVPQSVGGPMPDTATLYMPPATRNPFADPTWAQASGEASESTVALGLQSGPAAGPSVEATEILSGRASQPRERPARQHGLSAAVATQAAVMPTGGDAHDSALSMQDGGGTLVISRVAAQQGSGNERGATPSASGRSPHEILFIPVGPTSKATAMEQMQPGQREVVVPGMRAILFRDTPRPPDPNDVFGGLANAAGGGSMQAASSKQAGTPGMTPLDAVINTAWQDMALYAQAQQRAKSQGVTPQPPQHQLRSQPVEPARLQTQPMLHEQPPSSITDEQHFHAQDAQGADDTQRRALPATATVPGQAHAARQEFEWPDHPLDIKIPVPLLPLPQLLSLPAQQLNLMRYQEEMFKEELRREPRLRERPIDFVSFRFWQRQLTALLILRTLKLLAERTIGPDELSLLRYARANVLAGMGVALDGSASTGNAASASETDVGELADLEAVAVSALAQMTEAAVRTSLRRFAPNDRAASGAATSASGTGASGGGGTGESRGSDTGDVESKGATTQVQGGFTLSHADGVDAAQACRQAQTMANSAPAAATRPGVLHGQLAAMDVDDGQVGTASSSSMQAGAVKPAAEDVDAQRRTVRAPVFSANSFAEEGTQMDVDEDLETVRSNNEGHESKRGAPSNDHGGSGSAADEDSGDDEVTVDSDEDGLVIDTQGVLVRVVMATAFRVSAFTGGSLCLTDATPACLLAQPSARDRCEHATSILTKRRALPLCRRKRNWRCYPWMSSTDIWRTRRSTAYQT